MNREECLARVAAAMAAYDSGSAHRIHHFTKVHGFARTIAVLEGLDEEQRFTLELAALTHDIGIKKSLEKYGSGAGEYQQIEGPALVRELLAPFALEPQRVERICFLLAHHHTYSNIEGDDYRILVEADFLVNLHEHGSEMPEVRAAYEKIFRTDTGRYLLEQLFPGCGNA